MKLDLSLLGDACTVGEKLAKEEAERALAYLELDEWEGAALSSLVDDLTKQAYRDAKKQGIADRGKKRLRRPSEPEASDILWGINAKGLKRSEDFTALKDRFLEVVRKHAPQNPAGRREKVLYDVQAAVLRLIRDVELQAYEAGYTAGII